MPIGGLAWVRTMLPDPLPPPSDIADDGASIQRPSI